MIYLSIDLDYWGEKLPLDWFEQIAVLPVSKVVVISHEHLIGHANKFTAEFDTLVNIDYHSDLASHDGEPIQKDEGTWANFIKQSKEKVFIWAPPRRECLTHSTGYCHGVGYLNPFRTKNPDKNGWRQAKIQTRFIPDLSQCVAVGISLSPYWTSCEIMYQFAKWHQQHVGKFQLGSGVKTTLQSAMKLEQA